MQGSSSFLTVKQVATALGIDERSVRDKLTIGTLKGTKRNVGNKEQWFVHQRDLDGELARRGINPLRSTTENGSVTSPPPSHSSFDASPPTSTHSSLGASSPPEVTSAPKTIESVYTGGEEAEVVDDVVAEVTEVSEADNATSGGERHAWLNEDMQKQLMATAEVFMKPLVDRIEALTAADKEKDVLLQAKERELEEARQQLKLLPDLEAQRARLLKEIEAERQASEVQFAKARDREEEAKKLSEENESLKLKAEEAVLSASKLQELEKVVHELQKPKLGFWQKFFGAREQ